MNLGKPRPEPDEPLIINNRDEAESTMALVVAFTLQLTEAVNEQNGMLQAARVKDAAISHFRQRIARGEAALKEWAGTHRKSMFGESKSIDLRHGSIGFRMGNRVVKLLEGITDADVLARLRKLRGKFRDYIRVKQEVDRQSILADSRPEVAKLKDADLAKMGVQVTRVETFWVEPKLEAIV